MRLWSSPQVFQRPEFGYALTIAGRLGPPQEIVQADCLAGLGVNHRLQRSKGPSVW